MSNMYMEIDSPSLNESQDTQMELIDSPLLNLKTSRRPAATSTPFLLHKSTALKRPLTASPNVDSPTCSVLAADFSSNFHVNNSNFKANNPKKMLLPSMMSEEDDDKENNSFFFPQIISSAHDQQDTSTLRRAGAINRKLTRKSSVNHFKSNSLASSFYHSRSASSSAVVLNTHKSILSLRAAAKYDTETFTDGDDEYDHNPIKEQSLVDPKQLTPRSYFKSVSLDSLALPTPVREKLSIVSSTISPETQSVMNRNHHRLNLKKSFSLMTQPTNSHKAFDSSSSASSSSSSSENEEDEDDLHFNPVIQNTIHLDDDDDDDIDESEASFGSPLQRREKAHNKNRLELNANLRGRLQRAISFGPSSTKPNTFKQRPILNLSTSCLQQNRSSSSLSAGTAQLTHNINGLTFRMSPSENTFSAEDNSVLLKTDIKTFEGADSTLPSIDVEQFHTILSDFASAKSVDSNNKFLKHFDELVIVDCRFEYEFQGGHIDGAINLSSKKELEDYFLDDAIVLKSPIESTAQSRKLIVFHCEFSSHRGPLMANNLRTWDRLLNKEFYPNLYYPDIVILDGGYKKFYEKYNGFNCYPLNYVEMHDPQYKEECEKGLDKLRRDSKLNLNRKDSFHGLTRKSSQRTLTMQRSFTFGSTLNFGAATTRTLKGHIKSKSVSIFNLENKTFDFTSSSTSSHNDTGSDSIFGGGFENAKKVDLDTYFDDSPVTQKTINLHNNSSNSVFSSSKKSTHSASSSVSSFEFSLPSTVPEITIPPATSFPEQPPSHVFKLPSLPRRSKTHMRSQTISSFHFSSTTSSSSSSNSNSIPPGMSTSNNSNTGAYRSTFQRKFQKHIDTPITKKNSA